MKRFLFILSSFFTCSVLLAQVTTRDVDWRKFMAQHDMVWDAIKSDYYSGAILGNGLLGTNIYASQNNGYRWDIGRSDVTESREGGDNLFDKARLPIGHFELKPIGKVLSEKMRLDIYDAIATGKIETDKGAIAFKTYVDANRDVIVIETKSTGSEVDYDFQWNPDVAISPRAVFSYTKARTPQRYLDKPNPKVKIIKKGKYTFSVQELYAKKTYVTAWYTEKKNSEQQVLVTVSFENSTGEAIKAAEQNIQKYLKQGIEQQESKHKEWWNNYYPASFVSFPDTRFESFYWIQQYKYACLTRSDKMIIDLMGPWTYPTPWPGVWWNLNVQLTYSPLFTANRLELSEPLWNALNEKKQALIENIPVKEWQADAACIGRSSSYDLVSILDPKLAENNQYETGNLTWVLYYYWEYCMYKADKEELVKKFYPLLKRCIALYSHLLNKGDDGKYHLPLTASPEYKAAKDCNYDLALLRWGINTLLNINTEYSLNDLLEKHWLDVKVNLTDYPVDNKQGFLIGKDVKLESSHRHYSHLLMIYPLHEINWEQEYNHNLIQRSLNHWIGLEGALQGYSYTGSSSIYSIMGDGDKAAKQLKDLLDKFIQPNTLYKETGPVIETPLSAVTSLHELYLQSWGDKIRIFPAVPIAWQDASFIDLRAKGGFLVSAFRVKGATKMIQLKSLAGEKCIVQTGLDMSKTSIKLADQDKKVEYKLLDENKGIVEINLAKGETIQIINNSLIGEKSSYAISHPSSELNYYGVSKR